MRRAALALAALVGVAAPAARADAPTFVLTQQGRLLDSGDLPVDGAVKLRFVLYASAAPQAGETKLWEDTYTAQVSKGSYALQLGSQADGGTKTLTADLFPAGAPRYLAVAVNDGAEMSPRLRVGTVPLALSAQLLGEHPAADFLLKTEASAAFAPLNDPAKSVTLKSLVLAETSAAPLTVASSALVENLNAEMIGGKKLADLTALFAPATGSASYAPATGSPNYAPMSSTQATPSFKSLVLAEASAAPLTVSSSALVANLNAEMVGGKKLADLTSMFAPATGSTAYAPATGSPNYAPATGSTAYAPATGSPNYVAKAGDGSAAVGKLTVGGQPVIAAAGLLGDSSVNNAGTNGPLPLATSGWASPTSYYSYVPFGLAYAQRPVVLLTPWETDNAGATWTRIEQESLGGFTFIYGYYNQGCTSFSVCPNPGGVAWTALPAGTYTADDGRKMVAAVVDNRSTNCSQNCAVSFPTGAFQQPPVVVLTVDETVDDSGAVSARVENVTSAGFTYSTTWNGNFTSSESLHFLAVDPGTGAVLRFGPRLTVGAGVAAVAGAPNTGTVTMSNDNTTFTTPPVVLATVNRQGGSANATATRIISFPSKRTFGYYNYTDSAGGNAQAIDWVAIDLH